MAASQLSQLRVGLSDITSGIELLDKLEAKDFESPPVNAPDWLRPDDYHVFRAVPRAMVGDLSGSLEDMPEYALDESSLEQGNPGSARSHMAETAMYNALGRVWAMQGHSIEASRAFEMDVSLASRTGDDAGLAINIMNWIVYLVLPYFTDDLELRHSLLERHDRAWSRAVDKFGVGPMPDGVSRLLTSYLDGAWSEMDWMDNWWQVRMVESSSSWAVVREVVFASRAHAQGDLERARGEIRRVLPDGPVTEPGDCIFRGGEELQRVAIELELDAGNLEEAHAWLQAHDRWLDWSGAFTGKAEGRLLWAQYHSANGDRRACPTFR